MPDPLQLIITSDGSHSLFNTTLNETYHSTHGAVQESVHVFIRQGLEFLTASHPKSPIRVLEIGFGTGLNALLALQYAKERGLLVEYETWETNPIDIELVHQLNYPDTLDFEQSRIYLERLHSRPWHEVDPILRDFRFMKNLGRIQDANLGESRFDGIFFDAFAPSKQPEMWELSVLAKVTRAMKRGGVFVTYCAKGQLKRDLRSLGLVVETLPGPPGKKEMVRGIKP